MGITLYQNKKEENLLNFLALSTTKTILSRLNWFVDR